MANFTITGNIGGTTGSGATIELRDKANSINQSTSADSSGNYTFTVPDLTTYILTAFLAGKSIRQAHQVILNGGNVSNVNFQVFSLTDANQPSF